MEIRAYRIDDLEAVIAIFRSNIPKYFTPEEEPGLRAFLSDLRAVDYEVVETGGEIVGAGGIGMNDDGTVSLCWGMIRHERLGNGLGKRLTLHRMERANEKFPGRALMISTSQHTSGFYEKLGFRLTEHVLDGYGPGIDTCRMRLEDREKLARKAE